MRRILVVKLADIGDLLTATPALRSLRRTFRSASITALVSPHCGEFLQSAGLVDEVLTLDPGTWGRRPQAPGSERRTQRQVSPLALALRLRRRRFDAFVLLHHLTTPAGVARYAALSAAVAAPVRAGLDNGRGWFLTHRASDMGFGERHEVEYCNDVTGLLGAPPDLGPLVFPLCGADREFAAHALGGGPGRDGQPRIAVHPGGGTYSLARRWPLERFAAVAGRLAAGGAQVVAVGGPGEESLGEAVTAAAGPGAVDLTGRTSLRQLGAVLQGCHVFLGNDSGVMHIAAAVGTPVVALFGPSNDRAWGPWSPNRTATVLQSDLPCRPCFYRGRELGTPEGCPNRTCLDLVTEDQVMETVQALLPVPPAAALKA